MWLESIRLEIVRSDILISEQLVMNPWCSPERVGVRHLKNRVMDLGADRKPAETFTSGLEPPEQLQTLSVPPNNSLGFDDDQWLLLLLITNQDATPRIYNTPL